MKKRHKSHPFNVFDLLVYENCLLNAERLQLIMESLLYIEFRHQLGKLTTTDTDKHKYKYKHKHKRQSALNEKPIMRVGMHDT